MATMLTPHFTLEELVESQTASRCGLDNEPDEAALLNLKKLCEVLEMIRALLGKPILISSGYRCPAVNEAVGGAAKSQHCTGQAVDFTCPGFGPPHAICKAIMAEPRIKYDQLIHEYNAWVHISVPAAGSEAKMQALTINRSGVHNGIA